MKGIINKGIQDLVEHEMGSDIWAQVKERAGCEEPFFATSEDYPDQLTMKLIDAAADVCGRRQDEIMVDLGRFWVIHTGRTSYPSLFSVAGSDPREFLCNMNKVHEQATRSVTNAAPPRFEFNEMPDGRLLIHYHSSRSLCPLFRGLVLGVGKLFKQELTVEEVACARKGASHCTMEVTFL